MGGAHGWERRRDDRHQVGSISRVLRWVPHTKIQCAFFDVLQHNRSWERPFAHQPKKLGQDGRTARHRVKLADPSDHDSPSNTSWETKHSSVDTSLVTPELDCPQSMSKALDLRYRLHELECDTSTVDTAHGCVVKTAQHVLVHTLEILRYLRHGGERHEEQIDAHSRVLHLDERHESVGDRVHLGDFRLVGHLSEDALEVIEVVVDGDGFGRNDEGIDIRS